MTFIKQPEHIPAGNIPATLARARTPSLAASSPRPMMHDHLAITDSSNVHTLSTGVRGDEQRSDLGLIILAQNSGRCSIEFSAFLWRETDLVTAAMAFLELLQ